MSGVNYMEKLLDGVAVEWCTLGDEKFVEIANSGRRPVKASERSPGDVPYYGANNIQDYVEGFTHDGAYVLIAEDGTASLENYSVQWATGKFWANNHVHVLRGIGFLNSRFLFHYLKIVNFIPFLSGGDRAKLTKGKLVDIPIPIPCPDNPKKSLEIQTEIVRILDNFTELTAELHARKKQYTYYRDKLLTFEDGEVEWTTLGDICSIGVGQAPTSNEFGNISFVNAGTTPSGFLSIYNSEPDTITTPSRGQGGIGFVGYQSKEFWCGPLCYRIKSTSEKVLTRFIYFFMTNNNLKIIELANMAGVPALNKKELIGFQIPIPPLEEQNRIVAILDKFDALTTSLTSGLPREIELRQKQYAYYRDMLLSFPKVESEA